MDKAAADRRRTVSHPCRFRRWQRAGTWQRIFAQLRARADAKEIITWDINVDSPRSSRS